MARSRGGRSAPRQQTRSAHTMSAPPARQAPPPPPQAHAQQQQGRQPGLFGQMASTAAGVAVGSTIGHTLANGVSSLFGGNSSSVDQQQYDSSVAQQNQYSQQQQTSACDVDARNFTKCLDENNGNMQICEWYLQQLKACQQAASNY